MHATTTSRKHLPPPAEQEALNFDALFTDAEAEQIKRGLVPEQMEDKWFIYFEDDWLRFHRSWTGAHIYAIRFANSITGVRVIESWVNRNPQQYGATDAEYDRKLVRFLIDALLLTKSGVVFPMPHGAPARPKGGVQHSYVGRAYPESGNQK